MVSPLCGNLQSDQPLGTGLIVAIPDFDKWTVSIVRVDDTSVPDYRIWQASLESYPLLCPASRPSVRLTEYLHLCSFPISLPSRQRGSPQMSLIVDQRHSISTIPLVAVFAGCQREHTTLPASSLQPPQCCSDGFQPCLGKPL